jgi:hypothetical protein
MANDVGIRASKSGVIGWGQQPPKVDRRGEYLQAQGDQREHPPDMAGAKHLSLFPSARTPHALKNRFCVPPSSLIDFTVSEQSGLAERT